MNSLQLGPFSAVADKSTTAEGQNYLTVDMSALLALLVAFFKRIKVVCRGENCSQRWL